MGPSTPPRLAEAMRYSVFPGGGRVRPRLVLAVAEACGNPASPVVEAAAAAVELMHCASLVHDDLPQFDNAPLRRGRPAVHVAFGAELATLVGDGLIVAAFEALAAGCIHDPWKLGPLVSVLGAGVGTSRGIVAGQAWESEPTIDLRAYHQAKTGALFVASAQAGAIAGGGDPTAWTPLAQLLGEAYQVADDIADVVGTTKTLGKPAGQDAMHDRPSAMRSLGVQGAYARLERLFDRMTESIPSCTGRERFEAWIGALCSRIFPTKPAERTPSTTPAVASFYLEASA